MTAFLVCFTDSTLFSDDNLRTMAADERHVMEFSTQDLESAKLLPERLIECFRRAQELREIANTTAPINIRTRQDELTQTIKSSLIIPKLRRYKKPKWFSSQKIKLDPKEKRAVLVVGADGYIGRRHLAALPRAFSYCEGDLRLLGGFDISRKFPSRGTIEIFRDSNPGIPPVFFTNIQQAIESARSNYGLGPSQIVAIIATPDEVHLRNIQELAALGIREFIVEKPLAADLESTDAIIKFSRAHNLKVVGAGQVFTADIVDKVREIMDRHHFQLAQGLYYWTKDRTQRSLAGENMGNPHIFTFDLFHLLGLAEVFNEVKSVDYAYSRDMALPEHNKVLENHALGITFTTHNNSVQSICFISFEEPGRYYANQKTVNLIGKDGSVIIFDVAVDDKCGETVIYVSPEHEVEVYPVMENTTTMLAKAQAVFLRDLLGKGEQPSNSPTSLPFQRKMVVFQDQSISLAAKQKGSMGRGRWDYNATRRPESGSEGNYFEGGWEKIIAISRTDPIKNAPQFDKEHVGVHYAKTALAYLTDGIRRVIQEDLGFISLPTYTELIAALKLAGKIQDDVSDAAARTVDEETAEHRQMLQSKI